jgi:HSP20 family protein
MASTPVEVKKATPAKASVPDTWQSFRNEMDRVFDRFSGAFGWPSLRRMFDVEPAWRYESSFSFPSPAVDMTEDDKAYKVTAELPGLESKDIDVSVTGDVLTIKGEKQQEKEQKEKNYYVSERSYGSFQRSFMLPQGVEANKIAADLSKGVLTITLPKTAEAQKQAKKIEVKAA